MGPEPTVRLRDLHHIHRNHLTGPMSPLLRTVLLVLALIIVAGLGLGTVLSALLRPLLDALP